MKILVISLYNDFSSVRPEAEIFTGLSKLGHEVHIMTDSSSKYASIFKDHGIRVINFVPSKKLDRKEINYIKEFLIREQYEIMHLFHSAAIINGIQAARRIDVKVVLYRGFAGHIHWYDPLAYLKYLHPRVDKIMCNSKGVEDYLRKQMIFGKDKPVTINKGHKLEWYADIVPNDIRQEFNIPEDAFLLVNVANNRKMKGIPYLLRAMNNIPPELNIHLLLIGRNMQTKENLEIIENGPNKDKIHFPGFRKDILQCVKACDVFVLSSIYGESITKSVLEAMSLGLTPLITDIPGNYELVVDGESGFRVPSKNSKAISDGILKLYHDRAFCKSMGNKARERIENELNNKTTIVKVEKLYKGLIAS